VKNICCVIIRSFTAEGDGKSIMEVWNERGSSGIIDVVNAIGVADCLSKLIASNRRKFNCPVV